MRIQPLDVMASHEGIRRSRREETLEPEQQHQSLVTSTPTSGFRVPPRIQLLDAAALHNLAFAASPRAPTFAAVLKPLIDQLVRGQALVADQIAAAVAQLIDAGVPVEEKADFLGALAHKGENAEEIAAFARELREKCIPIPLDASVRNAELLDVVGTGGDRLGTFNISTCSALIAASAGVCVAKHGNRAVTSKVGSADVVEALGLPVSLAPGQAADMLREHGFVFLFAPRYHPTFQHIAPARKLCAARGERTIFNFLGPLLNPARPSALLVGVPRPGLCEPLARVLQQLGARRAMVVSGAVPVEGAQAGAGPSTPFDFLDEFSTLGETTVAEFYHDRGFHQSVFDPRSLPLQAARLADLRGGDREDNARIVRQVLAGEDRGPRRDAVLLNAGAALFVAGQVRSIAEGWDRAGELIDTGQAGAKLKELVAAASPAAGVS
jgi:anthranilate phosphoribosyltransferase